MNKKTLTEEIGRIFEIMNNEKGMVILESNLLLEGPNINIETIIKSTEKWLDRNSKKYVESKLKNEPFFKVPGSFEVKLSNFIEKGLKTDEGRNKVREFVKSLSSISKPFSDFFAKESEKGLKELEDLYKNEPGRFDRIITAKFGEEVLKSYRRIPPTSSVGSRAGSATPKPPKAKPPKAKPQSLPTTIPIPSELKDSDGVKDFQIWLNNNKPKWFRNMEMKIGSNNYGKFEKNTSKAWETHQIEYLRETKPPSDLNTSEQIKDFQKWMDTKNPNWIVDSDGNVRNLLQGKGWGKYDTNTRKAWEKYGEKYRKTYGTRQRIRAFDLTSTKPKGLSKLEKICATDKTFIDGVRAYSLSFLKSITAYIKGEQVIIDDIFGKFITVLDEMKVKGVLADNITFFRDISLSFQSLKNGKIDIYETFVKDAENVLKSSKKYTDDEIKSVIDYLKSTDPLDPKNQSWLSKIWGESSFNNFMTVLTEKKLTINPKLKAIIKRGMMLLSSGSIKLPTEYMSHVREKGTKKGLFEIWLVASLITKVVMPIFFTIVGTIVSIIRGIWGGRVNEDTITEFKDILKNQYESIFTFGRVFKKVSIPSVLISTLIPWNWHWNNFFGYLMGKSDEAIDGTVHTSLKKQEDVYKQILTAKTDSINKVYNKKTDSLNNVKDKEIEDLKNQVKQLNKTQVVTNIDNSEAGFIAWCNEQEPKRIYKPGSYTNGYAQTIDGGNWQWNGKTFEPY